jgi:hypothetical protein
MPNWCLNVIKITGNEADINTILDAKMSFNKLLPRPELYAAEDRTHSKKIGWSQRNWGTKWDIVDDVKNELIDGNTVELCDSSCIKANVMTASAPPIAFFETLTSQMEDLQVKMCFWEPGDEFIGEVDIYNGHTHWEKVKDEVEFIRQWFDSEYEKDEDDDF